MSYKKKEDRVSFEKLRWKNMSDIEKEIRAERAKKRLKMIRKFIADYKLKEGCKDCGYNKHHAALEFDHVRGIKSNNIPQMRSLKKIIEEITKCEVVCSNCHKIRTYNRYPDTYKND